MVTLLSEAIKAGNLIIFLDDAQLFFGNGPGLRPKSDTAADYPKPAVKINCRHDTT